MRCAFVMLGFLIGLLAVSQSELTEYHNYKVYHVKPTTEEHVTFLKTLQQNPEIDFWTEIRQLNREVDVMISPALQPFFEQHLRERGIEYSVMINNVEELVERERTKQVAARTKSTRSGQRLSLFEAYYRHEEINSYLRELAEEYPNILSLEVAGSTLEGRELIFAKVSVDPGNAERPVIVLTGGIHAREWIAPSTVLYVLQQLVENPDNRELVENTDWYILPVLNPDGYEFSHTTSRSWRKTRSQGAVCFGVDANRNFDYFWGTVGSSASECSETYRGPAARSEIETRIYESFARRYADRVKAFVDFHSYGELLLYPWGYKEEAPENGDELQRVGDAIADAINAYNSSTVYTVGVSSIAIYPTSGDTVDWTYGALGVPLAYTLELPGRGGGFLLPVEEIESVVKETFEGVRVLARYVAGLL